jgi:hypothetical protein
MIPDNRSRLICLLFRLSRSQPKSNVSNRIIRRHPLDHTNPIIYSNDSYGWHFQYLTIIGLALSTLTFAFGLLADITLSRRLFAVKNALSVASAPIECLITILYWGLRAVSSLNLPPK